MLFRDQEGNLVEINRSNYKNDSIYYKKIESIRMGENRMGENRMGERGPQKVAVAGSGSIERIMSLVEKSKTDN
jgi:hypothetical protein